MLSLLGKGPSLHPALRREHRPQPGPPAVPCGRRRHVDARSPDPTVTPSLSKSKMERRNDGEQHPLAAGTCPALPKPGYSGTLATRTAGRRLPCALFLRSSTDHAWEHHGLLDLVVPQLPASGYSCNLCVLQMGKKER